MKKFVILLLFFSAVPYLTLAAEVRNLKVGQEGDTAVATYDLVGSAGERESEVTVAITIDGRRRTSDQLRLSGDFGKIVTVGTGKRIVWNATADLPSDFDGELGWDVTASGGVAKVAKGWLGVSIQIITPELAQSFGLKGVEGVLVTDVFKDSPAIGAGIEIGDVILGYDGRQINEKMDLPRFVAATPVGKTVSIRIVRNGKEMELAVTIERLKGKGSGETAMAPDRLGITVSELTSGLAAKSGLREPNGVVVVEVKAGGIAEKAGIVKGDVVREINGTRITGATDYVKTVAAHKKGGIMRLLLRRVDSSFFVAMKVD